MPLPADLAPTLRTLVATVRLSPKVPVCPRNSAEECHASNVKVAGSNPAGDTIYACSSTEEFFPAKEKVAGSIPVGRAK
jgi:hypothetical protein